MERSCTVGVEGGVCVCADQPLAIDAPTLYFVLDRSGSMSDNGKWTTVQSVLRDVVTELGPRAQYAFAVFPNPQTDGCDPGVEIFPAGINRPPVQIEAPPGIQGNVEAIFSTLQQISASGGTPTAQTLRNLTNRIESLPGKTYVVFATDGGPNCNSAATCSVSMCTDNIEDQPGCPPGAAPNCCAETGGNEACLDAQPSIDAVAAHREARASPCTCSASPRASHTRRCSMSWRWLAGPRAAASRNTTR